MMSLRQPLGSEMRNASRLNFCGLVLSTVAAGFMIYAPPRVDQFTSAGQPIVTVVGSARPEWRWLGELQELWWLGPLMLAVGFALQAPAAWCMLRAEASGQHNAARLNRQHGENVAHPSTDPWHHRLANWAMLLAGMAALLGGLRGLWSDQVTLAATGITAGLVLCLAASIERFESLKGMGIEAKTRELKATIDHADALLARTKQLTETAGSALIQLNSRVGRWDSAPPAREAHTLVQDLVGSFNAAGSSQEFIRRAVTPWALSCAHDIACALLTPYHQALRETGGPFLESGHIEAERQHQANLVNQVAGWRLEDFSANLRREVDSAPSYAPRAAVERLRQGVEAWAPELDALAKNLDFIDVTRSLRALQQVQSGFGLPE